MAIVFKGRVFSIEVEKTRTPGGRETTVETVRHAASVVLLPMKDEGHVVLIRQFRYSVGRELWELPAGGVNPGESAESAAARECEEEIALVPGHVERIRHVFPAPGFCDEVLIYFRVSDLRAPDPDSPHAPDEDEEIEAHVFTVAEAKAMVERGDICDLKTAFGLTLI
jgi:ADP-ribose pyrophosphatase